MKKVFTLIVLIIIFISGCDSSTSSNGPSISGKITSAPNGVGGVNVKIYKMPSEDEELSELFIQYNLFGYVPPNEVYFDKSLENLIGETITNSSGEWELNTDESNFVAFYSKDNSFALAFSNTEGVVADTELKTSHPPLEGIISEDTIIPENSSVYVKGRVIVDEFATLSIGKGSVVAFSDTTGGIEAGAINVFGRLEMVGDGSNYIKCYGLSDSSMTAFNGIKIGEDAEGEFKYVVMNNASTGILLLKSSPIIENCIFINNTTGIKTEINNAGSIKNNLIIGNDKGFDIFKTANMEFTRNIFYNNNQGLLIYGTSNFDVNNSIFKKNEYGITWGYAVTGTFRNNIITENSIGIYGYGEAYDDIGVTTPLITLNNFISNTQNDIHLGTDINAIATYVKNANPTINNNNFYTSNIINIELSHKNFSHNSLDIDCKNNWWSGETNPFEIELRIYDKDDVSENLKDIYGQVLFDPVIPQEITEAGLGR